jgi:shikimate dehydrogenase
MTEDIRPCEPRACVVGFPIKHSRSPIIHGYWLKIHGLKGSYGLREVTPENFPAFLADLPGQGLVGCNVTVPHKEAAFRLVQQTTDRARALGAVNTVWIEDGVVHGDNTDIIGFLANLDAQAPAWRQQTRRAVVLGAGGAARGVVAGLLDAGVGHVDLVNRTRERARALAAPLGDRVTPMGWEERDAVLPRADLLVNTTSLGMQGQPPLDVSVETMKPGAVVSDIVYVPLETALLARARARGLVAVDGLGMLLHQAVVGFSHWFGVRPTVTPELRECVVADLEGRAT